MPIDVMFYGDILRFVAFVVNIALPLDDFVDKNSEKHSDIDVEMSICLLSLGKLGSCSAVLVRKNSRAGMNSTLIIKSYCI